jgi:CheY-like chemotaxis protein
MALRGLSILVVEDDHDALEITRRMLAFLGARVETARNGREGLTKLEKACPDLALVDIMMPEIDGLEFCRRVRGMRKCMQARLVALTALRSEESYLASWEAGFDGHVEKPITIEKLRAIAERHARRRALRRKRDRREPS